MCVELAAPRTNTSPPQAARWWCPEMAGTTPRRLSPPSSAWPRPTASARCRTHSPALGHTTCRQMRTCLLCVRTHLPSGASSQRHSARNQPCRPPLARLGARTEEPAPMLCQASQAHGKRHVLVFICTRSCTGRAHGEQTGDLLPCRCVRCTRTCARGHRCGSVWTACCRRPRCRRSSAPATAGRPTEASS